MFTMPGFAKFRVVKKPATKSREGRPSQAADDVRGESRKQSVRARAIKAIKDAVA